MLLDKDRSLSLSVSVTTRPPRPGEEEGVHYYFVSHERFAELRASGELLESAEVFGNFYGTPRRPVEQRIEQGRDMVFDIDWQGCRALSALMPADCVRIFILPPSRDELERRVRNRGADSRDVIEARLAAADSEMSHWHEYDYVIVNSDLDESLACLESIVRAERCRRSRMGGLPAFVESLQRAPSTAGGR
jgi:guanylate kinase